MAAHATHHPMQIPSGARTWRPRVHRTRRQPGIRRTVRNKAWRISTAGFGALSIAGVAALLAGFDSAAVAIVAVAAAVTTGVLGHLAPAPPASEVLRPTRKEAF